MKLNYLSSDSLTQKKIPLPAKSSVDICIFSIEDPSLSAVSKRVLSQQELQRSGAFRQEKDRIRYVTSRILLRQILGLYLNYPAEKLVFKTVEHGKPYLFFPKDNLPKIHFNLSHSGELVALAFSLSSPVGIDIETARAKIRSEAIVRRFFHPDEYSEFLKLDPAAQKDFMLRRWTVREAFLKGIGKGFSKLPDSFYVEELSSMFYIKKSQEDYSSWRIEPIPVCDGYYCSIAYQISE